MLDYRKQFLDFAVHCGALKFGQFTLKSGRLSPYFFNSGMFQSGAQLARLADFYAAAIARCVAGEFMLFGPAYKGIPLAAAVAIALARNHGRDVNYAFNRKESKDHGEGGVLVGAALGGRVVIVDDVITAGTSVTEAVRLIEGAGAVPAAVVVALDREENKKDQAAMLLQKHSVQLHAVARFRDLLEFLSADARHKESLAAMREYAARFGVGAAP